MIFNDKKFNKEIGLLKKIKQTELDPQTKLRLSNSVLSRLSRAEQTEQTQTSMFVFRYRYLASILLGLGLVGGTAFASNSAKPGDFLFPVKKVTEKVQVNLAPSSEVKARIQAEIAQKRIEDLKNVKHDNKERAEVEAETEVNSAIGVLQEVRVKLETKGNTEAAEAVEKNIQKLQQRAKENSLNIKAEVKGASKKSENGKSQSEAVKESVQKKVEEKKQQQNEEFENRMEELKKSLELKFESGLNRGR